MIAVGALVMLLVGAAGGVTLAAVPAGAATPAAAPTVWLCRPGLANNPCTASLTARVVRANGTTRLQRTRQPKNPPIDCFYVYPTVSTQSTVNANLHIDPQERFVARAQASRFSQVCRVYAPMYPQLTVSAIKGAISPQAAVIAYLGVLSAWNNYLAHYNKGRGVVLIGHSQGASLLIALIKREIDPNASQRHLLVSALLMGGNVTVPVGRTVGGDFAHIPACQSNSQTGCVVAYSTFATPPPADAFFGRVGTSIGSTVGGSVTATAGLQILCTNPADLKGGTRPLTPYFPSSAPRTPWVTYPNLYTSSCESTGGATWLQVNDIAGPRDKRPVVGPSPTLGPRWGLHLDDVNLALGNLVAIVHDESVAYAR